MVILQPANWRLGGTGSLDADGNGDEGGGVDAVARVGVWMLMVGGKDESWKDV